jgi:hypothetical protein
VIAKDLSPKLWDSLSQESVRVFTSPLVNYLLPVTCYRERLPFLPQVRNSAWISRNGFAKRQKVERALSVCFLSKIGSTTRFDYAFLIS